MRKNSSSLKTIFSLLGLSAMMLGAGTAAASGDDSHGDTGGHYPAHIVGVFVGATDADTTEFTIGAEYELKFSKRFGVGGVVEHIPQAHHGDGVTVAVAALHFHPAGGLRLTAGIGEEWVHGAHPTSHGLFRLGAAYDFEVGGFGLAPTINVDFVNDEEVIVFGVALSKHF